MIKILHYHNLNAYSLNKMTYYLTTISIYFSLSLPLSIYIVYGSVCLYIFYMALYIFGFVGYIISLHHRTRCSKGKISTLSYSLILAQ